MFIYLVITHVNYNVIFCLIYNFFVQNSFKSSLFLEKKFNKF